MVSRNSIYASDFLLTAVMVLVFVQSGLAFLVLFPIVHFGICLLDAFLMDSSRIAQHCSVDLSLKSSFQYLEVIIYLISL